MTGDFFSPLFFLCGGWNWCGAMTGQPFCWFGDPLVCTPRDAYLCFMRTEMDYLVLETCVLDKKEQPEFGEKADWKSEFKLD